MSELKNKVLEQITEHKVTPKPRWHFVMRNVLVWFSGIAFLLIGAVAISVMIFVIQNSAWEVREALGYSRVGHMMRIFPVMWFVAFGLFVAITKWALSHTKNGYKYPLSIIVICIFFASVVLGFTFNIIGMSALVDGSLGNRVPGYKTIEHRRDLLMNKPHTGRITGIIREKDEIFFTLEHKKKDTYWKVDSQKIPPRKKKLIEVGQAVLVVGEEGSGETFTAIDIHPLAAVKKRLLRIKRDKEEGRIAPEQRPQR